MATCSMAAACGFVVAPNVTSNTTAPRPGMVSFSAKNSFKDSRLVVRFGEAGSGEGQGGFEPEKAQPNPEPVASPGEPKADSKPAPVGPPRGSKDPKTRYPVVVRFNKVNYANVSTNNYALDEVEVVS
ncbi:photosystem I reaction center subunit IV A, chloroplastic [Dorcoceras hygrometricum]|uniref:Photosystem I reaction center subunit IV A, chloroplastic n=1 Tax=Dorcoceras hygrometricum TaxID=472368 RepID=A0A2Z7AI76_9LAMI|nr:photosystem I reaction center subunit IV A, chloroplastic [Dorcoceras hygrometricum]